MTLEHLEGTRYGPFEIRIGAEKVAEYVTATGDSADRWDKAAPPSFAGALLFAVAPGYFDSEIVRRHSRVLVHADQRFTWHAPLRIGAAVTVNAAVHRVRNRRGIDFVTFAATVEHGDELWLESASTFLHGAEAPDDPAAEHDEPPVAAVATNETTPSVVDDRISMQRSASRLDLVRYAGASGDFNAIHFDHITGVDAGFSGTIVHGLLMSAWLSQLATAVSGGDHPLRDARFRYRLPLYPAEQAEATALIRPGSPRTLDWKLSRDRDLVTGKATLNEG